MRHRVGLVCKLEVTCLVERVKVWPLERMHDAVLYCIIIRFWMQITPFFPGTRFLVHRVSSATGDDANAKSGLVEREFKKFDTNISMHLTGSPFDNNV